MLRHHRYIKNCFAVLLLAIFALSNTPTRFLHKIFANHHDVVTQTSALSDAPQLNVSGIDCHCNSTVVIVPFIGAREISVEKTAPVFINYFSERTPDIYCTRLFSFGLRGPPVLA